MNSRRLAQRSAVALALAMVTCASSAAPPATADPAAAIAVVATVYASGAAPATDQATIGALESGCPLYAGLNPEQLGPGGATAPSINPNASWSIGTLLSQCLPTQIPLSSVSGVTIIGSNGEPQLDSGAQLTQADLQSPSDFSNANESPVLSDDGDGINYLRPWRGGADDNAADVITTNAPGSFALEVFTGPLLNVTASGSADSVAAGASVSFTASVSGSPSGLSYTWNFDGGAPAASGAMATATFPDPGVYEVSVEATDSAGGGGYGQLQLTVAALNPSAGTTTTGPANSQGADPGAKRGTSKHRSTPARRRKHRAKPRRRPDRRKAPPPSSSGGAGTTTPTRGIAPAGPPRHTATPATRRAASTIAQGEKPPASGPAARRPKPSGVRVSGRLLGGAVAVEPALSGGASGLSSAPRVEVADSTTLGFLAAGAAVLLLLGLGAARELWDIRLPR